MCDGIVLIPIVPFSNNKQNIYRTLIGRHFHVACYATCLLEHGGWCDKDECLCPSWSVHVNGPVCQNPGHVSSWCRILWWCVMLLRVLSRHIVSRTFCTTRSPTQEWFTCWLVSSNAHRLVCRVPAPHTYISCDDTTTHALHSHSSHDFPQPSWACQHSHHNHNHSYVTYSHIYSHLRVLHNLACNNIYCHIYHVHIHIRQSQQQSHNITYNNITIYILT